MNIPITSSLVIVAATAVVAVFQGNRLSDVKGQQTVLEEKASALGLSLEGKPAAKSEVAAAESGAGKSSRGAGAGASGRDPSGGSDPKAEAKEFAKELFAFAKRMKEIEKSGEEPSREDKVALFAFLNKFLALDAEVLPFLMDEVRSFSGLEEDDKRNILRFAMMTMAQTAPEKALDLYLSSDELMGEDREGGEMVVMALGGWAAKDPAAALKWLDENGASLEDKTVMRIRTVAIANAFATDPDYAVTQALQMEKEQVMKLAEHLGTMNQSPQDQLDVLRRIQGKLGALPDDPSQIEDEFEESASTDQLLHGVLLVGLGQSLSRQPFEASREFLESANLGDTEAFVVAVGIAENSGGLQDPGAWLPWLHENSPEVKREDTVSHVVQGWTQRDFRATATWIGEQPQGALRDSATYTFAETVAPHEPASAATWALTLPASEQRTELLQTIHRHWAGSDEAAAAAFARENGLSE